MRLRFLPLCLVVFGSIASAQELRIVEVEVRLDARGDAEILAKTTLTKAAYAALKAQCAPAGADAEVAAHTLSRRLGLHRFWTDFERKRALFDDAAATASLRTSVRGAARAEKDGVWSIVPGGDIGKAAGAVASASDSYDDRGGRVQVNLAIHPPAGSADLRRARAPDRFVYDLAAAADAGKASVDFEIDVKPFLMSCAAKTYGYEKFRTMWLARAKLRNKGTASVHDYRVRFQLSDYTTEWSSWAKSPRVVPGQTVVDAYHPILDLEKLAGVDGRRPAVLKYEYEFRDSAGKVTAESDSRKLDILGRNDSVFSSLPADEAVDFYDRSDLVWAVAGSIVGKDDPVVQQLAGKVLAQAGGVLSCSSNDDHALIFAKELCRFIGHNKIAYQTPPWGRQGREFVQHIKFPRDVLANRAGTCIDLAFFYASAFEAVGLQPTLVVIQGHCYVAVRLPVSKKLLPIEATVMSGDINAAVKHGAEKFAEIDKGAAAVLIDIASLRFEGVHPLQLPAVFGNQLDALGYEAAKREVIETPPDTSKGTTVKLSSDDGEGAASDIAVDASGEIHVVFTEMLKRTLRLFHRSSKDGGKTWSEAIDLAEDEPGRMSLPPQLVIDGKGRLHCFWKTAEYGKGRGEDILGTLCLRHFEGGKWKALKRVGTANHVMGHFTSVDGDGNLHVVWNEDVVASDFGQFSGKRGAMMVFRASVEGNTVGQPVGILQKRPVFAKNSSATDYEGYRGIRGVMYKGEVRFISEKYPSAQLRAIDLDIVHYDGKAERTLYPVKRFSQQARNYSPTTEFVETPCELLVDADGKDWMLVYDVTATKPRIARRRLDQDEVETLVASDSGSGKVLGMQLIRRAGGKAELLAVVRGNGHTSNGLGLESGSLMLTEFDGRKWGEPKGIEIPGLNVFAGALTRNVAGETLMSVSVFTKDETSVRFFKPAPPMPTPAGK